MLPLYTELNVFKTCSACMARERMHAEQLTSDRADPEGHDPECTEGGDTDSRPCRRPRTAVRSARQAPPSFGLSLEPPPEPPPSSLRPFSFVSPASLLQTGHAPGPCSLSVFCATRICSVRLASCGMPSPPSAFHVWSENWSPP